MSKNLITRFRQFWRTLSPLEQRRLCDIFTALRGEDGGEDYVKVCTTARIRGLLFGKKLRHKGIVGFFRADPEKNIDLQKLRDNMNPHFHSHILMAIHALKPYVKKEKFTDLQEFISTRQD